MPRCFSSKFTKKPGPFHDRFMKIFSCETYFYFKGGGLFRATTTDMRYFARSKLSRSLVHKKNFSLILAGMDAAQNHIWDVSYSVSETSQIGLIYKSLRRVPGDCSKTSPQRRLWDLSGFLRDVFELHLTVILGLQTKALFT